MRSIFMAGFALAGALTLSACDSMPSTKADAKEAKSTAAANVAAQAAETQIFEVFHDGRINQFYDYKTYQSFLNVGETAYRLTRIGGGPKGETLVFGLTKADKKKGLNTPAAMIWDGKSEASENFYGEMHKHGRIYVFDTMADMKHVRELGHPNFMFTEIGMGPKGETVVFVLNKANKKKKPVAQIAKYKALNGMK
ncbi:hypothetical protein [Thiomicrorhabdus indica]|uniref:hypothetical protein n=1 Tax=Thiomicrorhabdus indica TaxID=2267253 RepID=UPI001F0F8F4C|nr:hypothetical protein [Thiomicrorhabdus indica]